MADPIESAEAFLGNLCRDTAVEQVKARDAALTASVREPLERQIAELEDLAYVGEHHHPDLTYKARLEELVPKLRELEAQLASAREEALRELIDRLRAEAGLHSAYDCTVLSMAIEGLLELLPATPQQPSRVEPGGGTDG